MQISNMTAAKSGDWSQKYSCCQKCGTDARPHLANGLCRSCYWNSIEKRHTAVKANRGQASSILTRAFLVEHYCEKKQSLSDISAQVGCSRQFVHKQLKEFGIESRNQSAARETALDKKKIRFKRVGLDDEPTTVTLLRQETNHAFFKTWSARMAYVLGVICTDGNIQPFVVRNNGTSQAARITLAQNAPELVEKVLKLMDSNAKIIFRPRREFASTVAGALYYFNVNSAELYDDLVALGLTPNKSLTLRCPEIPDEHVSHFIRGCWDGDGCISFQSSNNRPVASFVSGSKAFIQGLLRHLYAQGLPTRILMEDNRGKNTAWSFRYTGTQCRLLSEYLYRDSDETMRLNRKYDLFQKVTSPAL